MTCLRGQAMRKISGHCSLAMCLAEDGLICTSCSPYFSSISSNASANRRRSVDRLIRPSGPSCCWTTSDSFDRPWYLVGERGRWRCVAPDPARMPTASSELRPECSRHYRPQDLPASALAHICVRHRLRQRTLFVQPQLMGCWLWNTP